MGYRGMSRQFVKTAVAQTAYRSTRLTDLLKASLPNSRISTWKNQVASLKARLAFTDKSLSHLRGQERAMETHSHDLEERRNYLRERVAQEKVRIQDYKVELDELERQLS